MTLQPEEEHVIGRRFVPKGSLSAQWNLKLLSCRPCNQNKASLENDISAITMQPNVLGQHASDDHLLIADSRRKASAINRRTGQPVSNREAPIKIAFDFGPVNFSFSFVGPPQPDEDRIFRLAQMQLAGFFFLITYDDASRRGYWWKGGFAPIVAARKEDWGNEHLRWIETLSRGWDYRLYAVTAEGFFKTWIKRRLGEPAVWAWALEWNRAYRVAGLAGDEDSLQEIFTRLPTLQFSQLNQRDNYLRFRSEIPLSESDDIMFEPPPDEM